MSRSKDIEWLEWNGDSDLEADVFVHKLTDWMLEARSAQHQEDLMAVEKKVKLQEIRNWMEANPQMRVVDPLDSVAQMMNRDQMLALLERASVESGGSRMICPVTILR